MVTVKDNQLINDKGEYIGDFCQKHHIWCFIPENYIHRYSVEDLELILKFLKSKEGCKK